MDISMLRVPLPPDADTQRIHEYCVEWGLQHDCLMTTQEAYCEKHKIQTVPSLWKLHVCPMCALEQRLTRRQMLNIDRKIQVTQANLAARMQNAGKKATAKLSRGGELRQRADIDPI